MGIKIDVSIIIVNYNTKQLTIDCINSVNRTTSGVNYEVILVDNASTDGSKEYFEKQDGITYIYSLTNLGFGKANNLGVKHAKGRNILFLNSDTILVNNAVKILSDYLDTSMSGACGGNLFNMKMKPTHSFQKNFNPVFIEFDRLLRGRLRKWIYGENFDFNHTGKPISVDYICGADLMVKSEMFNQLEGFSPLFFLYYEETDLCYRIRKLGYDIKVIPQAEIQHLEGGSLRKAETGFNYMKWEMMSKSRKIFNHRHYSAFSMKLAEIIMFMNFRITGFLNKNKSIHYKKLIAIYKKA